MDRVGVKARVRLGVGLGGTRPVTLRYIDENRVCLAGCASLRTPKSQSSHNGLCYDVVSVFEVWLFNDNSVSDVARLGSAMQ